MSDDVIYHGVYRETGGCLVLTETPEGEVTGMVAHIPYHSPDGMGWGYGGSGPADCARSLLIAALGEAARCPECNGTRYTVIDTDADPNAEGVDDAIRPYDRKRDGLLSEVDPELVGRCWCNGGWRHLPYMDFKWRFVARFPVSPGEWRLPRSAILAWLAHQPALS